MHSQQAANWTVCVMLCCPRKNHNTMIKIYKYLYTALLRTRITLLRAWILLPLSLWCGSGSGSRSCSSLKWREPAATSLQIQPPHGSPLSLYSTPKFGNIYGSPLLHFELPQLPNFAFDADPDPGPVYDYDTDRDPDPDFRWCGFGCRFGSGSSFQKWCGSMRIRIRNSALF